MMTAPFTLSEINSLERDAFIAALGELYEGPPWIVTEAYSARPFESLNDLHAALDTVMWRAPRQIQLQLLRAHPDLVGKAARSGTLSAPSSHEQAAAGLYQLTDEEIAVFGRLNAAYHQRFGFPFVICARENKKQSILAGFQTRLVHQESEEIETALHEVSKIAWFRLADTVRPDDQKPAVVTT